MPSDVPVCILEPKVYQDLQILCQEPTTGATAERHKRELPDCDKNFLKAVSKQHGAIPEVSHKADRCTYDSLRWYGEGMDLHQLGWQ